MAPTRGTPSLLDLLTLTQIAEQEFRAECVFDDQYVMFGGQLTAQALRAAGLTVDPRKRPHSLHAYFLRPGDATVPTDLEVCRERDGRSFSLRRVAGRQAGKPVFTMLASFQEIDEGDIGPDVQVHSAPLVKPPGIADPYLIPRLAGFEGRAASQKYPHEELRTRFWARCTEDLGDDPLLQACVVAYFTDITNAVAHLNTATYGAGASIDNAIWFHRSIAAEKWMLLDLEPGGAARGRGWYSGSVFDSEGVLLASLAQETLFRAGTPGPNGYFSLDRDALIP